MKGQRKYLSEFAVNLCSSRWLALPASQLASGGTMGDAEQAISDNCHIYLICQRPAVNYSAEGFSYEGGCLKGALEFRVGGNLGRIPFEIEFPLLDGAVGVKLSAYPHREIHTVDEGGEIVRLLPASALCVQLLEPSRAASLRDFEVLYVGQAFGDGTRSAFDRLKSHATLQKILAEAHYNSPDNEIVLFMFEYPYYRVITQMDGRAEGTISDERDGKRFYSILENHLSERQQICLVEAALIRYFSPKYNEIYKEKFPSQSHKILQECYQLDFSGLIVEINTEELAFALWSERVAPSGHHIAQIELATDEARRGFFYLSKGNGDFYEFPDVIR